MELYATGKGHQSTCVEIFIWFILICLTSIESTPRRYYSDECDWFGSGLEHQQKESIQPVYLRCREGIVEWQYPRGALRIILQMGQSGKEFRGCLKVESFSSGATLFLEKPQSLKYLSGLSEENMNKKNQICFKSVDGHVAFFLEARGNHGIVKKEVFRLMYDLEPVKSRGYSDCHPCSKRELVYLFCTSDFVARGFISSLYQNEEIQQTELTIHSYEILRDSEPRAFDHKIMNGKNDTYYVGTISRPLHCGTKVGTGEFLFVGRWRLGTPILSCAPRFSEWEKIRQEAIENDNLDCILQ